MLVITLPSELPRHCHRRDRAANVAEVMRRNDKPGAGVR
jgi:hypothetical protein